MSWSVQFIGTPEAVNRALDEQLEKMVEGQSKAEFAEAQPHLKALVSQIVGERIVVKLTASGHATFNESPGVRVKTYGVVSVALDQFYGLVV